MIKSRTLLFLILCASTAGCAWIEQPSSSFANRKEALEAGMFAKGWLPEWLPASTMQLREKHDIDTSAGILRFEYTPSVDVPPFGDRCIPTTADRVEHPRIDAFWWPETGELLAMPALYRCRDESGYLAIPAKSGTAYFWRTGA
jgi:hypothetical protein